MYDPLILMAISIHHHFFQMYFPTVLFQKGHGNFLQDYSFHAPSRETNYIHTAFDPKQKDYERMMEILFRGYPMTHKIPFRKVSIVKFT